MASNAKEEEKGDGLFLYVHKPSRSIVCKICHSSVGGSSSSCKTVRRHLREKHSISKKAAKEHVSNAFQVLEHESKGVIGNREDYLCYNIGTRGSECVSEIPYLSWSIGRICHLCDDKKIVRAGSTFRNHALTKHGGVENTEKKNEAGEADEDDGVFRCQYIRAARNSKNWFRLSASNDNSSTYLDRTLFVGSDEDWDLAVTKFGTGTNTEYNNGNTVMNGEESGNQRDTSIGNAGISHLHGHTNSIGSGPGSGQENGNGSKVGLFQSDGRINLENASSIGALPIPNTTTAIARSGGAAKSSGKAGAHADASTFLEFLMESEHKSRHPQHFKYDNRTADNEKSHFVSISGCDEKLEEYGITLESASGFYRSTSIDRQHRCIYPDEIEELCTEGLNEIFVEMFKFAQRLCRDRKVSRKILLDIATPGSVNKTRFFRFLNDDRAGEESCKRYARYAKYIVQLAVKAYFAEKKRREVERELENYEEEKEEEQQQQQEPLRPIVVDGIIGNGFQLRPELRKAVGEYVSYCCRSHNKSMGIVGEENTQSHGADPIGNDRHHRLLLIHCIQRAIFFEKVEHPKTHMDSFCDFLATMLCVQPAPSAGEEKTGGSLDKTRTTTQTSAAIASFSTPERVSRELAGIMYSISCCAAIEALAFDKPPSIIGNKESTGQNAGPSTSTPTTTPKQSSIGAILSYGTIQSALQPYSSYGLGALVDLRGIAFTLRSRAISLTKFTLCQDEAHGLCGVTKGVELSARELGNAVTRMLNDMERIMYESLFMGMALPSEIFKKIDRMEDDFLNTTPGYSALNDARNKFIQEEVRHWHATLISGTDTFNLEIGNRKMGGQWFSSEMWIDKARECLHLIVTCMHIVGGGPARGTELGSLLQENTVQCARSIYFTKGEVTIVGGYDKRRATSRGAVKVQSRHLDLRTSKLYKIFALFVRPILRARLLKNCIDQGKRDRLSAELQMGDWACDKTNSIVSGTWWKYGIRLKYGEYRHHQTGLVKELCRRENREEFFPALCGGGLGGGGNGGGYGQLGDPVGRRDGRQSIRMLSQGAGILGPHPQLEDELDEVQRAAFEQAAHTVRTAETRYAISAPTRESILSQLEINRSASTKWHSALGLRRTEVSGGLGYHQQNTSNNKNSNHYEQPKSIRKGNTSGKNGEKTGVPIMTHHPPLSPHDPIQAPQAPVCAFPIPSSSLKQRSQITNQPLPSPQPPCSYPRLSSTFFSLPSARSPLYTTTAATTTNTRLMDGMDRNENDGIPGNKGIEEGSSSADPSMDPECPDLLSIRRKLFSVPPAAAAAADAIADAEDGENDGAPPPTTADETNGNSPESAAKTLPTKFTQSTRPRESTFSRKGMSEKGVQVNECVEHEGMGIGNRVTKVETTIGDECLGILRGIFGHRWNDGYGIGNKERIGKRVCGWKSDEQRKGAIHIAQRQSDVLLILCTGGGKTAAVAAPILLEKGFTVWISPLRALRQDTERVLRSFGLHIYDVESCVDVMESIRLDGQRAVESFCSALGNVIMASPELFGLPIYMNTLKTLRGRGILNRIVIDEAHLVLLSSNYRECMVRCRSSAIESGYCQIVMLTATAPPNLVNAIADACGSCGPRGIGSGNLKFDDGGGGNGSRANAAMEYGNNRESLTVVRGDPYRSNLRYSVKFLACGKDETLYDAIKDEIEGHIGNKEVQTLAEAAGEGERVGQSEGMGKVFALQDHGLKTIIRKDVEGEIEIEGNRIIVYCMTVRDVVKIFATLQKWKEGNVTAATAAAFSRKEKVRTPTSSKIPGGHSASGFHLDLEVLMYHGRMSAVAAKQQMKRWWGNKDNGERCIENRDSGGAYGFGRTTTTTTTTNTTTKVMVATDAFGCGIDVPDVRLIIVAGGCRSLLEFIQQSGRAGRDGNPASVAVLYHRQHMRKQGTERSRDVLEMYRKDMGSFSEWAENSLVCRRATLEEVQGGAPFIRLTCIQRGRNSIKCDVCAEDVGGGGGGGIVVGEDVMPRKRKRETIYPHESMSSTKARKPMGKEVRVRSPGSPSNQFSIPWTKGIGNIGTKGRMRIGIGNKQTPSATTPPTPTTTTTIPTPNSSTKRRKGEERTQAVKILKDMAGRLRYICIYCSIKKFKDDSGDGDGDGGGSGGGSGCRSLGQSCIVRETTGFLGLGGISSSQRNTCLKECRREQDNIRCFRCWQTDHRISSKCPYFISQYGKGANRCQSDSSQGTFSRGNSESQGSSAACYNQARERRCGNCQLNTVGGISVHNGDMGRMCILGACTKLCLVAFSDSTLRKVIMQEGSPFFTELRSVNDEDLTKKFTRWLTKDGIHRSAGIVDMVQYLASVLSLFNRDTE